MELVFLNADDFLKAHLALHGKVEPSVNTSRLIKISIVIGRTYDEYEASLNNIFTVAAEYGIQLAQTRWNADADKAGKFRHSSCRPVLSMLDYIEEQCAADAFSSVLQELPSSLGRRLAIGSRSI